MFPVITKEVGGGAPHGKKKMLVAVNQIISRFTEKSVLKHEPNSGKPNSVLGYGNPEPSLSNQEGAETRRFAPQVGEGMARLSSKGEAKSFDWHRLVMVLPGSNFGVINPAKLVKPKSIQRYGNAKLAV